jgi:SAM-dependent methyltransferase
MPDLAPKLSPPHPEGSSGLPPIIDYEGSDYQQTFWDQGKRDYEDQVEAAALKRLLPLNGKLLLELGAGAGRNTPRYAGFERVVLLDYSLSQLQQAQARLGSNQHAIYVAADIYRLPFLANLFDAATMIRVLHHMADAPRALQQVHHVLKTGGVFILEYANKQNLKAILRYLLGRQSWSPFTREPVEFETLNFDFHPQAVRSWLQSCGFTIERQLTVSHFRLNLLKRIIPLSLLVSLDTLIQPSGKWFQLTPSVFLRAHVQGQVSSNMGDLQPDKFFRCLECNHFPLNKKGDRLFCPACNKFYPVVDGIYDFR